MPFIQLLKGHQIANALIEAQKSKAASGRNPRLQLKGAAAGF
jgi:hypothetical protein